MESVINAAEVEFYIETMQAQNIRKIATPAWVEWHQRLQKLHQEAILEASLVKDEHVKETLVSLQKVSVLVHEAITINIWKNKILPYITKQGEKSEGSFLIYTILYHEIVALGLLELILFHVDAAESLGDYAGDLLDYSYGNASKLLSLEYQEVNLKENFLEETERHKTNLSLEVGTKSLTLLRYLSEHLENLTLGVANQIYNTYDVPILLIQLLLCRPWIKNNKQYVSGQFVDWDGESLPQVESQVWLGLHQLLLNKLAMTYYPITENRRSQLVKILPLMSPVILDQISPLMMLKDALCRLTMSGDQPSAPPKPVLLEVVMEIKESVLKHVKGHCKKIAKEQSEFIFPKDKTVLMEMAKTLSEAYNTDLMEKFEEKKEQSCVKCGKSARQKCSRCKITVYCSRSCQVDDWALHKTICVESN